MIDLTFAEYMRIAEGTRIVEKGIKILEEEQSGRLQTDIG